MLRFEPCAALDNQPERDLMRVAEDVVLLVQKRIPGAPPNGNKPIQLDIGGTNYTHVSPMPINHYDMRLATNFKHLSYTLFACQLAQGLAHIMMGTQRSNRLIETLAILGSWQILEDMAEKWMTQPPYPGWLHFAHGFITHINSEKSKTLEKFPKPIGTAVKAGDWEIVANYLRQRQAEQVANTNDCDLDALGAIVLHSTDFKKDSELWPKLNGLASLIVPPLPANKSYYIAYDDNLPLRMEKLAPELKESFSKWLGY